MIQLLRRRVFLGIEQVSIYKPINIQENKDYYSFSWIHVCDFQVAGCSEVFINNLTFELDLERL